MRSRAIVAVTAFIALGAAATAIALFFRSRGHDGPARGANAFPLVAVIDTGFSWERWPAGPGAPGDSDRARVRLEDPASRDFTIPEDRLAMPGDPPPLADAHGHGTRIAAEILRGAPGASVLPIRVTRQGFFGTPELLARALAAALDSGADVINVSFGVKDDRGEGAREAGAQLERAARAGVVVVAAAGVGIDNPFRPGPLSGLLPQSDPSVIVVGSVFESGGALHPSRDENFGPETDLSVKVGEGQGSRSSTAAARVSAAVARALSNEGSRSAGGAAAVRHALRAASERLPDYFAASGGVLSEPRGGYGVLSGDAGVTAAVACRFHSGDARVVRVSAARPIRSTRLEAECGGSRSRVQASLEGPAGLRKGIATLRLEGALAPGCASVAVVETESSFAECRPQVVNLRAEGP